jgi:phage baseplate assembly protein W
VTKDVLGSGWQFPVRTNERGGIAMSSYEPKIRESIHIILGTAKGERMMRPDFGCAIHDFVFSIIDTSTLTMIRSAVRDALIRWEPRIEVLEVEAAGNTDMEGVLDVRIQYRVRATNTEANLVYPFYLKAGS